jgi:hypothetical protein
VANAVVVYAYNIWYPCTVHVLVYTLYVHVYSMYIHVFSTAVLSGYFGGISLYVHNGRFLYDSMVHTYVKGSTREHALANTVVVYAYKMWYPCTLYVHVYTLYVHVYEMYIHVLTSCLNSSS